MSQIQKILQRAEELGIKDNLFFVATMSDYKQIRDNMKKIGRELEKQGVMKNDRANPLLSEFNSCAITSANIAEKLMKMLGMQLEKKKSDKDTIGLKDQKKCPDFEMLPPVIALIFSRNCRDVIFKPSAKSLILIFCEAI